MYLCCLIILLLIKKGIKFVRGYLGVVSFKYYGMDEKMISFLFN